jgi:hypothetical protein
VVPCYKTLNGRIANCYFGIYFCKFGKNEHRMTVKELKDKLINEINQSQDNELLEDMYRLIKIHEDSGNLYILSGSR